MVESIQENDDPVHVSRRKLHSVAEKLVERVPKDLCRQLPCRLHTMYRCRCTFQCVWIDGKMQFAVRHNKNPFPIVQFPFANQRIQCAMIALLKYFNDEQVCVPMLRQNLTSVSFSSAWNDCDDADCFLTLFYDSPIIDGFKWRIEATRLCDVLKMTQITARSKKCVLFALHDKASMIRDKIWLTYRRHKWSVALASPPHDDVLDVPCVTRVVSYEKPEGAFCHPNASAMCDALEWLINRIDWINKNVHDSQMGKCRLLELYCGCGAHTMAILQTNILDAIVAVELDQRLVDACRKNYDLNRRKTSTLENTRTQLEIVSADAGVWSRSKGSSNGKLLPAFDILLVDPPRQGLDEHVCRLANNGTFQHFLYISCGHVALIRDLARLSVSFEVVDCVVLDLFPQLDAVETLLHLRRRIQ